jgi:WD40 repeat protein
VTGRVEYAAGAEFEAPHGRFELTVDADGTARLVHRRSGIERRFTGRLEAVVWPRLRDALRASQFPAMPRLGPPGSRVQDLRVTGFEPAGLPPNGEVWMRWGDGHQIGLTAALRILDALVHQVSNGAVKVTGDRLPWLTRRVRAEPVAVPPVPVAAFGTLDGAPVGGVVRDDGGVSVVAVPSGAPVAELPPTGARPRCMAFGRIAGIDVIVTGGDDAVLRIWPADGRPSQVQTRHAAPVSAIAATIGDDQPVTVWSADLAGGLLQRNLATDAAEQRRAPAWPTGGAGITALAWAGRWLVTGHDDGRVGLHPVGDPAAARFRPAHQGWVNAVAVLGVDDGLLIASGGADRTIRLTTVDATGAADADDPASPDAAGRRGREGGLGGHTESVTGLAFGLLNGRPVLGSCALDGTARTWDARTGEVLAHWATGDDWPAAMVDATTAGTQRWATAGGDGAVRVWDAATGEPVSTLTAGTSSAALALTAALLPGRTLLAAGYQDGTFAVWDAATGTAVGVDRSSPEPLSSVAYGTDGWPGVFVCGTAAGSVRAYDPATAGFRAVLTPHTDQVLSVAVADPVIVSGSADRTVRVWDARTGRPLACLTGHRDLVTVVAVAQIGDRTVIASGGYDRTVRIWDTATGRARHILDGPAPAVYALALGTAAGRAVLAAAGHDDAVRVWDAETGAPLLTTEPVPGFVRGIVIHGDVLVAAAGDGAVRSWTLPYGVDIAAVQTTGPALAIGLTPGGGAAVFGAGGVTDIDLPQFGG